jgi:uncharacterized membrane protein YbhN (UPF0104 family)
VALAVVAQALSYLGSGFMLHTILDTYQQKLSTLKGVLITMAAFSIGLVAGGWVGAAASTSLALISGSDIALGNETFDGGQASAEGLSQLPLFAR